MILYHVEYVIFKKATLVGVLPQYVMQMESIRQLLLFPLVSYFCLVFWLIHWSKFIIISCLILCKQKIKIEHFYWKYENKSNENNIEMYVSSWLKIKVGGSII